MSREDVHRLGTALEGVMTKRMKEGPSGRVSGGESWGGGDEWKKGSDVGAGGGEVGEKEGGLGESRGEGGEDVWQWLTLPPHILEDMGVKGRQWRDNGRMDGDWEEEEEEEEEEDVQKRVADLQTELTAVDPSVALPYYFPLPSQPSLSSDPHRRPILCSSSAPPPPVCAPPPRNSNASAYRRAKDGK